jgi:hypothetical protein
MSENKLALLEQDLDRERDRHAEDDETEPTAQALRRRKKAAARRRGTAFALSRPVSYRVPGTVPQVRQPKSMDCWATVTTMLVSWKQQSSTSIENVISAIGPVYRDMFDRNTGLPTSETAAFFVAAGLQSEPAMNYTLEGWEGLLRRYGPLWVTTDERSGPSFSLHARVMVGIEGDGTPEATTIHFIDPADGQAYSERFPAFLRKFEEVAGLSGPIDFQVIHFPADQAAAQSVAAAMGGLSYAQNPVAVAGLSYTIVKDAVVSLSNDITFERTRMEGVRHPNNDPSWDARGTWNRKDVTVSAGMTTRGIAGFGRDTQSADFAVEFKFNGHSIGFITIRNVGTNDAWGWKLHVMQDVIAAPDMEVRGTTPVAAMEVTFTYRHYSWAHSDQIYEERLTLFGTGDVQRVGRWRQSGGY